MLGDGPQRVSTKAITLIICPQTHWAPYDLEPLTNYMISDILFIGSQGTFVAVCDSSHTLNNNSRNMTYFLLNIF